MNNASLNSWPGVQCGLGRLPGTVATGWALPTVGVVHRARLPVAWAGRSQFVVVAQVAGSNEKLWMKTQKIIRVRQQPAPFTPGLTKDMVREHAQRLFDQRLLDHDPLTNEDWVLVERDLLEEIAK